MLICNMDASMEHVDQESDGNINWSVIDWRVSTYYLKPLS